MGKIKGNNVLYAFHLVIWAQLHLSPDKELDMTDCSFP